ncbi:3-keto-5-aminohexanoate cleavage protein [Nocardia sp. IFM 10818]
MPVTPEQVAGDAREVAAAGVGAVHIHPRDDGGAETLEGVGVGAVVRAVREVCPGVEIGVTTGAWIVPDVERRVEMVRGWAGLAGDRPDSASVNVCEEGWEQVCAALADAGIGVELGVWSVADAERVRAGGGPPRGTRRVLVEVQDVPGELAVAEAGRILGALRLAEGVPVLVHGEERSMWPVLAEAVRRGIDTRVGLEDTLVLPDGRPAEGNVALVRAALGIARGELRSMG